MTDAIAAAVASATTDPTLRQRVLAPTTTRAEPPRLLRDWVVAHRDRDGADVRRVLDALIDPGTLGSAELNLRLIAPLRAQFPCLAGVIDEVVGDYGALPYLVLGRVTRHLIEAVATDPEPVRRVMGWLDERHPWPDLRDPLHSLLALEVIGRVAPPGAPGEALRPMLGPRMTAVAAEFG